jgi:hypothetical protein
MAAAVQYLQEHKIFDYAVLEEKANGAADRYHDLSDKLKADRGGYKT